VLGLKIHVMLTLDLASNKIKLFDPHGGDSRNVFIELRYPLIKRLALMNSVNLALARGARIEIVRLI